MSSVRGRGSGRGRGRGGASKGTRQSTTLPKSLQTELIDSGALPSNFNPKRLGRKEKRKTDRLRAKETKQAWFNKGKDPLPSSRSALESAPAVSTSSAAPLPASTTTKPKKRKRATEEATAQPVKKAKQTPLEKLLASQEGPDADLPPSKRFNGSAALFPKSNAEQQEDKEIAWLESALGLDSKAAVKGKGKQKWQQELAEDGLDGQLVSCAML